MENRGVVSKNVFFTKVILTKTDSKILCNLLPMKVLTFYGKCGIIYIEKKKRKNKLNERGITYG